MSVTFAPDPNTTMATANVTPTDIFVTGCFNNFETVSCVRSASLTLLAVLTCVLCILKLIKFHHAHHPDWHQYFIFYCASLECAIAYWQGTIQASYAVMRQLLLSICRAGIIRHFPLEFTGWTILVPTLHAHHPDWHQYFIFYCASLECAIAGVHFILAIHVQFDFVLQWLKLTQFLVMCHFYWTLATRALRREVWATRFLIPFIVAACAYFTVIAVLGIVNVQTSFTECFQPYWLELSAAEFTIVQLFCVAGFYITRRLNEISTLDSVRRSQKRDLWCIVIVFEVSALIGFLYDLSVRIIGDEQSGCNDVFNYSQTVFSVVFFLFMVMKLLLPIWVMLFVFQPAPQAVVDNDDLIPALTDDGTSAFSPTIDEQYRQLYHPTEDYRNYGSDSSSPNSPYSYEGFANGYKRNYSQTNLDPIKEESGSKTVIQNKQNVSADTSVKNNSEQAQPQPEQPRPHSEQSRPQTDKNQALNVSPITQQKSLLNTSSQEAVSQGHGQQGLAQGQKSPVVQGQSSVIGQTKEQQSSQGQTVQVKGQEEDNSTVVQSLPVLMRQDVQSDIGQRSSTHPDQTDNLQELLKQVPAGQEPNVVNQPQETVLPPVQIQQGAKVREPSPPREGGHVRTNVSAAPRFTIQGSEDDEESPPSPKGKFFI